MFLKNKSASFFVGAKFLQGEFFTLDLNEALKGQQGNFLVSRPKFERELKLRRKSRKSSRKKKKKILPCGKNFMLTFKCNITFYSYGMFHKCTYKVLQCMVHILDFLVSLLLRRRKYPKAKTNFFFLPFLSPTTKKKEEKVALGIEMRRRRSGDQTH